jgi:phosphotransferase system HPr-like phosphotransfer protein
VDATSIIDILTLGCIEGSELKLHIEKSSDGNLLKQIAEIIEVGLEE